MSSLKKLYTSKKQREARLNRVRRLLAGGSQLPVVDYQRFNLAGLDLKGQRVSGFGQMGGGFTFAGEINAGNLMVPGVVRASLSANVGCNVAPRSLIVIQRDAAKSWAVQATSDKDKPKYTGRMPVSLHLLEGFSIEPEAGVSAQVGAGVGSAFSKDENGIAISAKAEVQGIYEYVNLTGRRPQYYATPTDPDLEAEFDALVNNRIKQAISLYIASYTRSGVGKRIIDMMDAAPEGPLDPRIEQAMAFSDYVNDDFYNTDSEVLWEEAQTNSARERLDGWDLAWTTDFGSIAKGMRKFYHSRNLKTSVLSRQIDKVLRATAYQLDKSRAFQNIVGKKNRYYADLAKDPAHQMSDKEREKLEKQITAYDEIIRTRESLMRAREILERRKSTKGLIDRGFPASTKSKAPSAVHKSQMRAHTWRCEMETGAAAKALLTVPGTFTAEAHAESLLTGEVERLGLTFETAGTKCIAWRPDGEMQPIGGAPLRVLSREQTVIVKKYLKLDSEAVARVQGRSEDFGASAGASHTKSFYGTMTYESARLCRVVRDAETKPDKDARVALLSGSGVSLGLSILTKRLDHYAEQCRKLTGTKGKQAKPIDKKARSVEKLLTDQLGVDKYNLRRFFKDVYLDGVPDDVGVLVEANYALRFDTIAFTKRQWKDKDPLDLRSVKDRLSRRVSETDVTVGNGTSYLQSLRVRLRMIEAEEKRRNVFGLGWAAPMSGSYEGKSGRHSLGGSIFRSYAAGVENTVDLSTKFFGQAADVMDRNRHFAYEYGVAPVALFNV